MSSFSSEVKAELCRVGVTKPCDALAELYGMALFASVFSRSELRILTTNVQLRRRIQTLAKLALPKTELKLEAAASANGRTQITIQDRASLDALLTAFGYADETRVALHLNGWLVWEDCCRAALLRAAFLTGGYMEEPERRYHLELSNTHAAFMGELKVLLSEMGLTPSQMKRAGESVLYFRDTEQIQTYLTLIGAHKAVLDFLEAHVVKDVRNKVNRKVNAETANMKKTIDSGAEQAELITALLERGAEELRDPRLREAAELRLAHPDEPISALAAMTNPPITKSGFSHRLRRLTDAARRRQDSDKEKPNA